jgi:hypothetical protein
MVDEAPESKQWSNPETLSWHRQGWIRPVRPIENTNEDTIRAIGELERIVRSPLVLLDRFLRNEKVELLPVGKPAYLILFYTVDNGLFLVFSAGGGARFLGKYKLKLTLWSTELNPKDYYFELEIPNWNNFTIKPVKE